MLPLPIMLPDPPASDAYVSLQGSRLVVINEPSCPA